MNSSDAVQELFDAINQATATLAIALAPVWDTIADFSDAIKPLMDQLTLPTKVDLDCWKRFMDRFNVDIDDLGTALESLDHRSVRTGTPPGGTGWYACLHNLGHGDPVRYYSVSHYSRAHALWLVRYQMWLQEEYILTAGGEVRNESQ